MVKLSGITPYSSTLTSQTFSFGIVKSHLNRNLLFFYKCTSIEAGDNQYTIPAKTSNSTFEYAENDLKNVN